MNYPRTLISGPLRAAAATALASTVVATGGPAAFAAPVNPRHSVVAAEAAVGTGVDDPVTPMIIGGKLVDPGDASYRAVGSFQHVRGEDPNWHRCTLWLWEDQRHAVTNAHCVTATDGTALPAERFHIRFGSADRLAGGFVVGVAKILHAKEWDWGAGSDIQADAAVLQLTERVPYKGFRTPPWTPGHAVRLIGWGLTAWPWEGPAPAKLSYLDSKVVDPAACAAAAIGAGEICVGHRDGAGVCYGDSGGPALTRFHHPRYRGTWAVIGGASRETTGDCSGPTVYTDWRYYAGWIETIVETGVGSPGARRQRPEDEG